MHTFFSSTPKPQLLHVGVMLMTMWLMLASVIAAAAATIQVDRDDKGAWFITGPEDAPLKEVFKAMGHSVATDRLWQMELYRRTGTGRLAEIFGEDLFESDKMMRTMGYSDSELTDAFNNLEPEEKDVIQGYVDGVNEHLLEVEADPSSLLPFEFVALGLTPEPWTTNQLLAWMVVLLRQADPEAFMLTQIENAAMITRLTRVYGEETAWAMFNDLRWTQDPAAMAIIDYGSGRNLRSERSLEDNIHLGTTRRKETNNFETCANKMIKQRMKALNALKQKNAIVKLGSYGWVVSGDHTESGYPTLYAGSQLGFEAPSIAGEGSIQAGGLNVSGEIIPAVPMIIDTVRTPHNTWGFQVASAHTTDYYLEDSNEVSLHRIETVLVAGQDDVELPVYRGRGPVVSAFGDKFITWKYSHWNYEFQSVGAFLKMLRATSIDEFEVGVNELGLSDHVLYADKEGNIAHWMAGRDPVRSSGEWRLPQGFLDDPIEWDAGVIKPIPTDRNTPRGWYGDWNNKPRVDYLTGLNSVYQIQGPFHGAHAIYDYLDEELVSKGRLTFKQIRDLTLNIAVTESLGVRFGAGGTPWVFVGKYFHDAVNRIGKTDARASALELLDSWDGKFVSGGKDFWINGTERAEGWVLSANWISEVLRMVFFDELAIPSEDGSLQLPGPERLMFNALLHGLEYPLSLTNRYDWFTNLNDSSAPQDADSIIVAALDKVLANWNTYDFSRGYITYGHDLLGEVWRAPLLNRATYDHLVEMGPGGPVRIESFFALGQSGYIGVNETGDPNNPIAPVFDPNFFSMTPLFDNFTHRQFPLFDFDPSSACGRGIVHSFAAGCFFFLLLLF